MADYNYSGVESDSLLLEIRRRKEKGSHSFDQLSESPSKADMVTALQQDDDAMRKAETTADGAVAIPDAPPMNFVHASCMPPPSNDKYKTNATRISDGLDYAIAIHEPDSYGKTVTAKNKTYFWQGTDEEFRLQFDKQPATADAPADKPADAPAE